MIIRTRHRAAAVMVSCVVAAAGATALGASGRAQAAAVTGLPGSVDPGVSASARVGAVPATQQLTVQVWLEPDLGGAAAFADAVATPGSAEFHAYLSPDDYTARFGPSAAQAAAVTAWLAGAGLTQVHADRGRDYVSATGPAAAIESALRVRLNRYRVAGADGRPAVIESNDRAVSVPAALAPDVLGVTGLDSAPAVTAVSASAAQTAACSHYWAQHVQAHPAYRGLTKAALPACGYSAGQLRSVYDATKAATGQGVTVALTEEEAPVAMLQTLKDYAKDNKLPAPASGQFQEKKIKGSATGCGAARTRPASADFFDDESQLDSEAVYAMAPSARQLMVITTGCNEDQDLLDAVTFVLAGNGKRPSATIVSNSWQLSDDTVTQAVHAIDVRAAAEGVGLYFAAGDTPGVPVTAGDPYATAVGGTTLGIGKSYKRVFETGWSDDFAGLENGKWDDIGTGSAGGGGTSLTWRQPAYQKGVVPASMSQVKVGGKIVIDRAVPDLAADGDPDSGMLVGYIATGTVSHPGPYQTESTAGTSLATPLVAGLVADAQQGKKTAFGFLNPLLYRLAGPKALLDVRPVNDTLPQLYRNAYIPASDGLGPGLDVFDSQGKRYTAQVTAKGYDTMTGVGTPNGAAFIAALRSAASQR